VNQMMSGLKSREAHIEGVLHLDTYLGKAVNSGEVLVHIHNPVTQERQTIWASHCGVVHDLNVHAKVNAGAAKNKSLYSQNFKLEKKPWLNRFKPCCGEACFWCFAAFYSGPVTAISGVFNAPGE